MISSYQEVKEMVDKLSSEMMRLDLCKETEGCGLSVSDGKEARLVGIYSKTRYEWVVAEYACYRCNATVVTLYDSLGVDATTFCLSHSLTARYIMKLTSLETVFCGEENAVKTLLAIKKSHPTDMKLATIIHMDALAPEVLADLDASGIRHYQLSQLIASVPLSLQRHV